MKNVLKNKAIIYLTLLFFTSCKKDIKIDTSKYTYTDDNITVTQIADNYLMIVDGAFSMSNSGLYGSVGVSRELPDFKYLRTSHILLNGKKLTPSTIAFFNDYIYSYPPSTSTPSESLEWQNYFASVYNESKTNFQLFDTTNNFIVGFIFRNPKPSVITIENQNYRTAPAGSRIIVHWSPDPSNSLGIAIAISGNNGIRYLNFSETGSADITDEVLAVGGTDRVSVTFSRGVILTGKGVDGRIYKLTSALSKTETVYI